MGAPQLSKMHFLREPSRRLLPASYAIEACKIAYSGFNLLPEASQAELTSARVLPGR